MRTFHAAVVLSGSCAALAACSPNGSSRDERTAEAAQPVLEEVWTADPADQSGAHLGYGIAGAGDVNGDGFGDLIVGGYGWSSPLYSMEGRAFLFLGSASGLAADPAWTADPTDQASGQFARVVAGAGDVNGDGFDDVIVARPGTVYVYYGSASGLGAAPDWTMFMPSGLFGQSAASAGDVNGDGYADIIVGASDAGPAQQGGAYAYLGGPDGLATTPAWSVIEPLAQSAKFGWSVSSAGDVNADGFSDVLVGAWVWSSASVTGEGEGRAYLYLGSATGLSPTPAWAADPTDLKFAGFGWSVAGGGDVDKDGYDDVVISSSSLDISNDKAYVYRGGPMGLGGPSGTSTIPDWTATGSAEDGFGSSVAMADVNGDGYADIIVGADTFQNEQLGEGRVDVFLGGASGLPAAPSWTVDPTDVYNAQFGAWVANAGDVNGDGLADIAVGAPGWNGGSAPNEGRAYVYMTTPPPPPDGGTSDGASSATASSGAAGSSSASTSAATGGPSGAGGAGTGGAAASSETSGDDGGCGCRLAGAPRAPNPAALLAAAALLAVRRRRRFAL